MELLRNSCSPDTFLFYTTKLDSMASSLESLLAHRRAKKKASRFRGTIDHNLTDNNLNQQVSNTNASTNDIPSNVTHNASTSTVTRKRSRRKTNRLTFIWIILLLSTSPVALYLPTRYLSFHVDSHSALHHDISTDRKFQPTFTTSHDACD